MAFPVPRSVKTGSHLVVYNASHPSVIFGKIKTGAIRHWNQNRMIRSINNWLKVPAKRMISKTSEKQSGNSGLIVPQPGKSFMLIQSRDMMSDLLAENHRLRQMVDDLVRETRD